MLFKKDINKKIEHLVKKNDFYAVADYVYGTKEEKLDLAKALGTNDNNSSVDLLLRLVDDKDDDVVYAACEALRNVGSEHNTADLLEKLNNLPKEKPPAGRALLYAALQKDLGRVLCIVTPGEAEATHFADDLKALGLTAAVFPPRDFMLRPVACFPVLLIGTQSGAKPRRFISRSFTRYFTFPS